MLCEDYGGRVDLAKAYYKALTSSVKNHFKGNGVIASMEHCNDFMFLGTETISLGRVGKLQNSNLYYLILYILTVAKIRHGDMTILFKFKLVKLKFFSKCCNVQNMILTCMLFTPSFPYFLASINKWEI